MLSGYLMPSQINREFKGLDTHPLDSQLSSAIGLDMK
jgi:hypothetical protein